MKKNHLVYLQAAAAILIIGTSCTPRVEPTPTMDPFDIMTQVVMTIQAEVTQAALLTPSPTATLPPTATPPPVPTQALAAGPTQAGSGFVPTLPAESPDKAALILDVTVPDGTVYWQGERFTKTWKIENTGTTTWKTSYMLIFYDGEIMSEQLNVSLVKPVEPGVQVELSVPMEAPDILGSYKSYWKMINDKGQPFGDTFWVEILVGTKADKTPTPSG